MRWTQGRQSADRFGGNRVVTAWCRAFGVGGTVVGGIHVRKRTMPRTLYFDSVTGQ